MLTSEYAPAKQAGNGVIVAFNFSFKILAATDLAVYKIDQNGVLSGLLVLNQDYTVAFDPVAENGTVTYTLAPVSGGYSLINRISDNTQQSSYPREGTAPAKTTETALDKLTALVQEVQVAFAALVLNGSTPLQIGSFAQMTALAAFNPTVPFAAIITDTKTFQVYTGNVNLGTNGWWVIGGGS